MNTYDAFMNSLTPMFHLRTSPAGAHEARPDPGGVKAEFQELKTAIDAMVKEIRTT